MASLKSCVLSLVLHPYVCYLDDVQEDQHFLTSAASSPRRRLKSGAETETKLKILGSRSTHEAILVDHIGYTGGRFGEA